MTRPRPLDEIVGSRARTAVRRARESALREEDAQHQAGILGGQVVREDLEAIQRRILTGLPPLPMACWRW